MVHAQVKKNATLAEDVAFARVSEYPGRWKLSSIAMSIMEMARPAEPHIIGLRRPSLSRKKVGIREPNYQKY